MRRWLLVVPAMVALGLAGASSAWAGTLTLHPDGFGPFSYAAWKAHQGTPDSSGSADQALYFQKMAPTVTNAAGIATIRGLEGQPTSSLADLGFDYRTDGHCGAGAPRFNVGVQPAVGPSYTFFVGCQGMSDTGSYSYGGYQWVRKDYTGPFPPGTITSLQIVFDEGNDQGQGYVYLDNIRVNAPNCGPGISAPGCWTGAADNGNH